MCEGLSKKYIGFIIFSWVRGDMDLQTALDKLYLEYNHRKYVHPDPLEFLYKYTKVKDREVVGLIASSLAYGRVNQILKSVSFVLNLMGKSPRDYLQSSSENKIQKDFSLFKHRFTTGEELALLLIALKKIIKENGSLEDCFYSKGLSIHESLERFVLKLLKYMKLPKTSLLADPSKSSACKRLYLFLRWMIRQDDVDPGGWNKYSSKDLIVPLDTHMFNIGKMFGFTCRKQANIKAAIDITESLRKYCKDDPVKYDFVLTRFGIREELDYSKLKDKCGF